MENRFERGWLFGGRYGCSSIDNGVGVVSDIVVEAGQETVQLIQDAGGEAHFVRADVSDMDDVASLVAAAVKQYGRLDFGINNAGIGSDWKRLADTQPELVPDAPAPAMERK